MALSFAKDIRPLFRDTPDVDTMKDFGLDLSSFDSVKAHAEEIYARVLDGSMPCDDPWPKEQVGVFQRWMEEGMPRYPALGKIAVTHGALKPKLIFSEVHTL